MKTSIIQSALCAVLLFLSAGLSAQTTNNVAYQDATVRFTVVTDGVIRLEWEPEGKFTDLPSFVASERNYPEIEFKVRKADYYGKKVFYIRISYRGAS